jgi:hypothetical protein
MPAIGSEIWLIYVVSIHHPRSRPYGTALLTHAGLFMEGEDESRGGWPEYQDEIYVSPNDCLERGYVTALLRLDPRL